MRRLPLLLLLLVFGSAEAIREDAASSFIINVADSVQTQQHRRSSETLFEFIYQRLNIEPEFRYLPSKRGLNMVNEGRFDAEAARLESVVTPYENLISVPEPVATFHTGVFCMEAQQCRLDGDSILAAFEGFRMAAPFCQKMQLTCKTTVNFQSLIKLLKHGLADALFATTLDAPQVICGLGVQDVFYRALPKLNVNGYHYVHKKHENLIPQLNDAIILAKQAGIVAKTLAFWREELANCDVTVVEIH